MWSAIGDRAADRLAVAHVAVGAEHARDRVAGPRAALELLDGALVNHPANLDLGGHRPQLSGISGNAPEPHLRS